MTAVALTVMALLVALVWILILSSDDDDFGGLA